MLLYFFFHAEQERSCESGKEQATVESYHKVLRISYCETEERLR